MAEELDRSLLEGGLITIRPKIWRGVVRTKDVKRIVWTCKHRHSRPEYNARYPGHDSIWEVSALNCGRLARDQWPNPTGDIGMVARDDISPDLRPDSRYVIVANTKYLGQVRLSDNGHRILTVDGGDVKGSINLDISISKGVTPPDTFDDQKMEWATAAWLLKGTVWGLIFSDHQVAMRADGVEPRAINEIFPDRSRTGTREPGSRLALPKEYDRKTKTLHHRLGTSEKLESSSKQLSPSQSTKITTTPHIRTEREGNQRVFQVIGWSDDVLKTFLHRGKAIEYLAKVKEKK